MTYIIRKHNLQISLRIRTTLSDFFTSRILYRQGCKGLFGSTLGATIRRYAFLTLRHIFVYQRMNVSGMKDAAKWERLYVNAPSF